MVSYQVEIAGTTYTGAIDIRVKQSISNYAREFEVVFKDGDRSKRDAINQYDDMEIWVNGTKVFKGKVEHKEPTREKKLILKGRDNSLRFHDILATEEFNDTLASDMFDSIIDTYFPGEFSKSIEATYILRDKTWAGTMIRDIFQELANNEGYVYYIDTTDTFVARPETFVDSGVTLTDSDIIKENFKEQSSRVINSVLVVYGPNLDNAVRRKDAGSISVYKEKQKKFNRSEITTVAEATAFGDSLLTKYANEVQPTKMVIRLDETLNVGEVIRVTSSTSGFSEQQFVILEVEHVLSRPATLIKVGILTEHTSEVLQDLIRKMRQVDENEQADTLSIETVDDTEETVNVEAYVKCERASESGALAGDFLAGSRLAGQRTESWTTVMSEQEATVTNEGIMAMLSILSQVNNKDGSVSQLYDGNNGHISIGNGSAVEKVTDTDLSSEQARKVLTDGYPKHPSPDATGELLLQVDIGDGDIFNASITEFGLENDLNNGQLFARYKHSSSISKSGDQKLRITWRLVFTGTNITTAGLNHIRDLLGGLSVEYVDNANASMEVADATDTNTHREDMPAGIPEFTNTLFNELRYKITVTNPGEFPTGSGFTVVRLYSETSGGIKLIESTIPEVVTSSGEDNTVRQLVKVERG